MPTTPVDDMAPPTRPSAEEHDHPHLEQNQSTTDYHGPSEDNRRGDGASDITSTNSSDEFNWDEDEEAAKATQDMKAKRGRALYLAFMKLARPFRVLIVGLLGVGILITPLLVVQLKFDGNSVRPQVHMWSFWLSVIWASSCITYIVVDSIPRMVVAIIVLFGGRVERLKTQLEACFAFSVWSYRTAAYA